jgi:hypothetical protein
MARLDDVDLVDRLFLKGYPFSRFAPRTGDPVSTAMTPLKKPLDECSVALVTEESAIARNQSPIWQLNACRHLVSILNLRHGAR